VGSASDRNRKQIKNVFAFKGLSMSNGLGSGTLQLPPPRAAKTRLARHFFSTFGLNAFRPGTLLEKLYCVSIGGQ
jgi:hypothetical protein